MIEVRKAAAAVGIFVLAACVSALAGPVYFTPVGYAGYASAGYTYQPVAPLVNYFYAQDPNSGHLISGTLTSGVYQHNVTGNFLFYYTIQVDVGSDPIDTLQLTSWNPPMYTQGITAMGYNTLVTGGDPLLIPTETMVWVPPGPPYARYRFDNGDGIEGGYTTEVFYIAGNTTQVVTGTATLINAISASVQAEVNAYGPPQEPPIPEPATIGILGMCLIGLGAWLRRK